MLAAHIILAASLHGSLEVGFCNSDGSGFYLTQPAEHLERWQRPYDNGSHLVIHWHSDRRVSGRNISSYHVDVKTSVPVFNFFLDQFGGFPQDVCAPEGSKARDAVDVEGDEGACVPYSRDAHTQPRTTAFPIPVALRSIAAFDVVVTARGWGSHAPIGKPGDATPCTFWCHKYRRVRREVSGSDTAAPADNATQVRPLSPVAMALHRFAAAVRDTWAKVTRRAASTKARGDP